MGRLELRLLGAPAVVHESGEVPSPRGAKPWALLAHLLLSGQALARAELAELLFEQAEDPLGALRWNLAEVRRLVGRPEQLRGPVPTLRLPSDASLDVAIVEAGESRALELPGFGQDLLAGLSFADSPRFEVWLASERSRLRRRAASLLRNEVVRLMGQADHQAARHQATRLVVLDPLDEGHQALLIRAHVQAGAVDAARAQYERCRQLLDDELAIEPGPAVQAAARSAWLQTEDLQRPAVTRSEISAHGRVGWQCFLAGAVDHGIALTRQAVEMADRSRQQDLGVMARLSLGGMLGISARSWDEAAMALSQATSTAREQQHEELAARAQALLAGNALMRTDYDAVVDHCNQAMAGSQNPEVQALSEAFLAAAEVETGRTEQAASRACGAVDLVRQAQGDPTTRVWAAGNAGHALLIAGELAQARAAIELAVEAATAPVAHPGPLALLAEIHVAQGEVDKANSLARQAAATAAAIQIPSQQAMSLRALALATAAAGDSRTGIEILVQALRHAERAPGEGYPYHWTIASTLDSLATLTAANDPAEASRWALRLEEHATATGMDEYRARARYHLEPGSNPPATLTSHK